MMTTSTTRRWRDEVRVSRNAFRALAPSIRSATGTRARGAAVREAVILARADRLRWRE
jgi:hypothetical protein